MVGNWVGEQLRRWSTGEPKHRTQRLYTGPDGVVGIAANPVITNLVPAVLVGLAIKPHWLWSFVGGVIAGGLIGERYETAFFDLVERENEQHVYTLWKITSMSDEQMDLLAHNRQAWDKNVERGNVWTIPVTQESVAEARHGRWEIVLTPTKPVPRDWFPVSLEDVDVLCLASGGGQQGPILAAAGANVTVFDNSPRQLEQDRVVAEREGLEIATVQGDMANLSIFEDGSFDLIVHPVSNVFVQDVRPVWREANRVLRSGGHLLAGFTNPAMYLFDFDLIESQNILQVVHKIPYSDMESLTADEKQHYVKEKLAFEFSHTLDDQIGGQIEAGFVITGFYEDRFPLVEDLLSQYMSVFIATRAMKGK